MEPGLSIRFLEADHRHRSVRRSVEGTALSYDLAACTGMARLGDLIGSPYDRLDPNTVRATIGESGKQLGSACRAILAESARVGEDEP